MFRLRGLPAALAVIACSVSPARAMPFTLTRLTDDTTDDWTSNVERHLSLDLQDRPHIAFTGASPSLYSGVFHAWLDSSWHVQPVAADTVASGSPTLACSHDGLLHFLHYRWTDEGSEIRHVPIDVDSLGPAETVFGGEYAEVPSIAVGPDDRLHAVCSRSSGTDYSRRDTGGWSVAETVCSGRMASIAVDTSGTCHIICEEPDSNWTSQVLYVHGTLGSWSAPVKLAGGGIHHARNASIAIAADGRVLVAYESETDSIYGIELRIHTGSAWSPPEWVAPGCCPSVAVDAHGDPYVAHWGQWGGGGLQLSFRHEQPTWVRVRVDSMARSWGEMPVRPGLALGAAGSIHIAYSSRDERGGEDSELWYACADAATDADGLQGLNGLSFAELPNPVRGAVRFRFMIPSAGPVRLDVHDVGGRLVRTLALGSRGAGMHEAMWDGRDAGERPVAPGVYFLRLRTAMMASGAQKLVVLR